MDLSMLDEDILESYKSASQRIRRLSEKWVSEEMFCPSCSSDHLESFEDNYPVADFFCPECEAQFQLKSQKTVFGGRVADGAYSKMVNAVRDGTQPSFFFLRYGLDWSVSDFFVVPRFFFTESVIEKRAPLSDTARRAGWIGCNILLSGIPVDGRIPVVLDSAAFDPEDVRASWKHVSFVGEKNVKDRSWLVDVMSCIEHLGKEEFTLNDLYDFEDQLRGLHPRNQNIQPKIRQQLQYLRDKGYLTFQGRGVYRIRK